MIMDEKTMVKSRWYSNNGLEFQVDYLRQQHEIIWVYYRRVSDDYQYNCLLPAFLSRFTMILA
jgi:hypothetical protein